ncbi:MAG: antA/AntB antirepressor family protein [Phycisphaerae bacterium]|nr:antA/AntB antirepressor family protein [Phycisphaerae bacterium]
MSNDLIKINYENDRQTVSGRSLHEFLEVDTPYRLWFPRMCEYGFTEDIDYTPYIFVHPQNGQETIDHQLTIEMSKEIAMLQRTEKGKQARLYFIELEKQWNSPEAVMARALKMADRKIHSLESGIKERDDKIKELTPAAEFGMTVGSNKGGILVRDYVKLLANDGIKIGQDQFFSWLNLHGYIYKTKEYKPQWLPYKQYVKDQELFKITEIPISSEFHGDFIKTTIRITGKGQKYFYEKLKNEYKPT